MNPLRKIPRSCLFMQTGGVDGKKFWFMSLHGFHSAHPQVEEVFSANLFLCLIKQRFHRTAKEEAIFFELLRLGIDCVLDLLKFALPLCPFR